jgi:hypothetical protein
MFLFSVGITNDGFQSHIVIYGSIEQSDHYTREIIISWQAYGICSQPSLTLGQKPSGKVKRIDRRLVKQILPHTLVLPMVLSS